MKKLLVLAGVFYLVLPAMAQDSGVTVTADEHYRYITSTGVPGHEHGQFPNAHNPNTISAQNYHFRMPLVPQLASTLTRVERRQLFGVATDGVPFDPGTAEFWGNDPSSGWNYDALSGAVNLGLDENHAHVQPTGAYHYHGVPTALVKGAMTLVGYAADGFPVYAETGLRSSYRLKEGTRPSGPGGKYDGSFVQDWEYKQGAGDLDECNGKEGVTGDYPQGTYFYVVTGAFPFVPRCLKGVPDASFIKEHKHTAPGAGGQEGLRGQGPQGNRDGRRGPPPEAIEACSGRGDGDTCGFSTPRGQMTGTCRTVPEGQKACVSERGRGPASF